MEALRHELAVTGGVRHAFWVMTKDSLYGFFPEYRTRKEKTGVIGELRTFAHEMGAWGTIWAADTWMVAPQESGEEPPEPPSQHPDRVDALMVLLTFPSGGVAFCSSRTGSRMARLCGAACTSSARALPVLAVSSHP